MESSKPQFRLSDPGKALAEDPAMREYLSCYGFPQPPDVRYGYLRIESTQPNDRVSLFGQVWLPDHALGTVALFHGYSEHSGNYARLVRELTKSRFAVTAMDLRGHGLSEGPRGHVNGPEVYAEDWENFLGQVFANVLPTRPLYIWGHSLGSLVALQTLHRSKLPVAPKAAVLSSALLGFPELTGKDKILAYFAPLIAKLLPSLPISHGISDETLSHDKDYLALRRADPLILHVTTPRWFTSMSAAIHGIQNVSGDFQKKSPTLCLLAGDERVTNLSDARKFAFTAYSSLRHKVIEFPGCYHELEKEGAIRERIVSESIAWFNSHNH